MLNSPHSTLDTISTDQDPAPDPTTWNDVQIGTFLEQLVGPIPTNFGKLHYLATLHGPEPGTYRHPVLGSFAPSHKLNHLLLTAHREMLHRWLELDLRQQQQDLARHLAEDAEDRSRLRRLRDRNALGAILPPHVHSHEQALFTSDLALLLEPLLLD
jgi:hypothetical protein